MKQLFDTTPLSGERARLFEEYIVCSLRLSQPVSESIESARAQTGGGRSVSNYEQTALAFLQSCLKGSTEESVATYKKSILGLSKEDAISELSSQLLTWMQSQIAYLRDNTDLVNRFVGTELSGEDAIKLVKDAIESQAIAFNQIFNPNKKIGPLSEALPILDRLEAKKIVDQSDIHGLADILDDADFKGLQGYVGSSTVGALRDYLDQCLNRYQIEYYGKSSIINNAFKESIFDENAFNRILSDEDPVGVEESGFSLMLFDLCMGRYKEHKEQSSLLKFLRKNKQQVVEAVRGKSVWRDALFKNATYIVNIIPSLLNDQDIDLARFLVKESLSYQDTDSPFSEETRFNIRGELLSYVEERYRLTLRLDKARLERIREGEVLKCIASITPSVEEHFAAVNSLLRQDIRAVYAYIEGMKEADYEALLPYVASLDYNFDIDPSNEAIRPYLLLRSVSGYQRARDFSTNLIYEKSKESQVLESYQAHSKSDCRLVEVHEKMKKRLDSLRRIDQAKKNRFLGASEKSLAAAAANINYLGDHVSSELFVKWKDLFIQKQGPASVSCGRYLYHFLDILNSNIRIDQQKNCQQLEQLFLICQQLLPTLLQSEQVDAEKVGIALALMERLDTTRKSDSLECRQPELNFLMDDVDYNQVKINMYNVNAYIDTLGRNSLLTDKELEQFDSAGKRVAVGTFASIATTVSASSVALALTLTGVVTGVVATAVPIVGAVLLFAALITCAVIAIVRAVKENKIKQARRQQLKDAIKTLNPETGHKQEQAVTQSATVSASSMFQPAQESPGTQNRSRLRSEPN